MGSLRPPPCRTVLWLADIGPLTDAQLAPYAGWLGESERQRHRRFVYAGRRRQFLAGRALLRLALGELLGMAPASVELIEQPGRGPALSFPQAGTVGFSISHSGPWVACAASTETALGLDIERIDPARNVLALADQAFGPDAVARLRAAAPQEMARMFYQSWCEHEARFKLGRALGAMHSFECLGLSGVLASARSPAADPIVELVDLAPD